jgi:D-proline reductase (dithiol) PrdB
MSSSRSTGCGSWPTRAAIGSVTQTHYSFMGATDPMQMEPHARELAGRLKQDAVDAVILPPV